MYWKVGFAFFAHCEGNIFWVTIWSYGNNRASLNLEGDCSCELDFPAVVTDLTCHCYLWIVLNCRKTIWCGEIKNGVFYNFGTSIWIFEGNFCCYKDCFAVLEHYFVLAFGAVIHSGTIYCVAIQNANGVVGVVAFYNNTFESKFFAKNVVS